MPRPTNKAQLIEQSEKYYTKLGQLFADLPSDMMVTPGIVGVWSIKDVLAHLYAWQEMALSWYQAGLRGEDPVTPSEKYTWRQIPELNQEICETYRDWSLEKVQSALSNSHQAMMAEIAILTDDVLFTPKVYKWTKSTTLGSYLTSATSSHYQWAVKEIRKGLKARQNTGD